MSKTPTLRREAAPALVDSPPHGTSQPRAATSALLLLEGDRGDRELAQRAVARMPGEWHCLGARSPAELLETASRERPGIIVLDSRPDGTTVPELVRALRRNEVTRPVPIVVIAMLRDPDLETAAIDAGAQVVVLKPLFADQYMELMQGLVRRWFPAETG